MTPGLKFKEILNILLEGIKKLQMIFKNMQIQTLFFMDSSLKWLTIIMYYMNNENKINHV